MDYDMRIAKIKHDIDEINSKLDEHTNKAHILSDDFNKDLNTKFELLKNYMTETELNNKLLEYEFCTIQPYKIPDLIELINFFIISLKKYQGKIGGQFVEDEEWIIKQYPEESRFKLRENMAIVYNTLGLNNISDKNTFDFADKMLKFIKQFALNIKVSLKIIRDDSNDIIWIIYIFKALHTS
jgi:hypothetical protein